MPAARNVRRGRASTAAAAATAATAAATAAAAAQQAANQQGNLDTAAVAAAAAAVQQPGQAQPSGQPGQQPAQLDNPAPVPLRRAGRVTIAGLQGQLQEQQDQAAQQLNDVQAQLQQALDRIAQGQQQPASAPPPPPPAPVSSSAEALRIAQLESQLAEFQAARQPSAANFMMGNQSHAHANIGAPPGLPNPPAAYGAAVQG